MVLKDIADDYELYLSYSYKICGCDSYKYDLLNEAYLKIDKYLKKHNKTEISKRFVYVSMYSIFIDKIRKEKRKGINVNIEDYNFVGECEESKESLQDRQAISEALSELKFVDREILLRTEEKSLRIVARQLKVNHVTIHNRRKKALLKLKEQWQKGKQQ